MASLENVSNGNIRLKQKRAASDIVFKVFLYVFLSIFAFITLYPVFNTLAYSLSDGTDSIKGGIHFFPRVWSLKSYEAILFKRESIWRGAAITAARTVIGTFLGVFANALLAYIISRRKFIFRKVPTSLFSPIHSQTKVLRLTRLLSNRKRIQSPLTTSLHHIRISRPRFLCL